MADEVGQAGNSAVNPYQAPRSTCVEAADTRCSFCGRLGKDAGNLVQSPDGGSFICGACTDVAGQMLRQSRLPSWLRVLGLAVQMVTLVGMTGILSWDAFIADEPQVTRLLTVPILLALAVGIIGSAHAILRGSTR